MRTKIGHATTTFCLISGLAAATAAAQPAAPAGETAVAQVGAPTTPAAEKTAPSEPASWRDAIKVSAHIDAGITLNPRRGDDHVNFGHLFTDRTNQPLLNQAAITVEKAVDPKIGYDWGFKFQAFYGSDARYTHFLGELDRITSDTHQLDIVEANVASHLPYLTEGGIDVKIGQYPTPLGYEVIDPKGNALYSHSYIFNFGIPLKHTGALVTAHLNDTVDLYAGIDTGVNTSLGDGDPNSSPGFIAGFGLNFLEGKFTILALSHLGAENPNNNHDLRYLNDIVATYKASDALTLVTELNYIHDELGTATTRATNGGGVAQYAIYALSETLSVVGRAEVWSDISGNLVCGFPGNQDFIRFESGNGALDPRARCSGRHTTYGGFTLGLNWKPPIIGVGEGTVIRPEIRYDHALDTSNPFQTRAIGGVPVGTAESQLTFGADLVIPF